MSGKRHISVLDTQNIVADQEKDDGVITVAREELKRMAHYEPKNNMPLVVFGLFILGIVFVFQITSIMLPTSDQRLAEMQVEVEKMRIIANQHIAVAQANAKAKEMAAFHAEQAARQARTISPDTLILLLLIGGVFVILVLLMKA